MDLSTNLSHNHHNVHTYIFFSAPFMTKTFRRLRTKMYLQNFFVKSDFFLYFFSTVHDKKCSAVYEDKCTTELVEECHSEIKEPTRFTLIYMFYPAGEVVKTCEKVPRTVSSK